MRVLLKVGDYVLIAICILPWLVALPRLGWPVGASVGDWLHWLGISSGILGLSTMLLAAAVSIRLPGFDRYFGGLARLWGIHRGLGFASFMLVMVHVLALGFSAASVSLTVAMATLFPPISHLSVWWGWFAWLAMLVFLAPTFNFFGSLNYQHWKSLHLLSAFAVIAGLLHAFLLAPQQFVWWLLGAAAVGAIIWRKVLSPHFSRVPYRVESVTPLVNNVVEIALSPESTAINYQSGQFIYLTPLDKTLAAGGGEEHPYTIASAPSDDCLRIGIKALGDASGALQTVTLGSRVMIEGPYGDFYNRDYPARDQLWLGGGIGITPFVSGARHMEAQQASHRPQGNVQLLYLAKNAERAYYHTLFKHVSQLCEEFVYDVHYFQQEGPLTEAYLRAFCPDYAEREIYMCGPPGMNQHLRRLLIEQGIPTSRIHSEVFDFL